MIFPAVLMCSGGSLERAGVYTVWGIFLTLAPLGLLLAIRRWEGAGSDGGLASEGESLIFDCTVIIFCVRVLLTLIMFYSLVPVTCYFHSARRAASIAWTMIITVVIARLWLWAFDLDHTQIMQERIAADVRGAVNGCQTALCVRARLLLPLHFVRIRLTI